MAATSVTNERRGGPPWWLVLIEGILAIIVGILLWMYPARTFVWLAFFIGIYWFISGIFDIVSIFFNRAMWGWKLFMGIIGILAGLFLINYQLRGATTLAYATAILIGVMGLFYGILALTRAFQGAGWGVGILGVVSMIFGVYILAHPLATTLVIPWLFGLLGIFGGILAIFGAFALRSAEKAQKAAAAKASVPTMARAAQVGDIAAAPAAPVAPAVAGVAAAGVAAAAVAKPEAAEAPTPAAEAVAADVPVETMTAVETAEEMPGEQVAEKMAEASEAEAGVVAEAPAAAGVAAAGVAAVAVSKPEVTEEPAPVSEVLAAEAPAETMMTVETAEAMPTEQPEEKMAEAEVIVGAAAVVAEAGQPEAGEVTEAPAAPAAAVVETSQAEAGETPAMAEEEPEVVEVPDVADIPEDQVRFLKQDIEYVEGIGPVYGGKLKAIGIATSLDLLSKGATRKGRELIAEASGISSKLILRWVNHADLFRVKGVGSEWADLLEAAGVDTVVELAVRNPTNLYNKMVATNEEKKLTRQVPSAAQVEKWVEQAKTLGRVVRY